jgi:hypothetical protein
MNKLLWALSLSLLAAGCSLIKETPKPPLLLPESQTQHSADSSIKISDWLAFTDSKLEGLSFAYPHTLQVKSIVNEEDVRKPFYTGSLFVQFTKDADVVKTPTGVFENPTFILSRWDNPQKLSPDEWYLQVVNDYAKGLQIDRDTIQLGGQQAYRYLDTKNNANYDYYFTDSSFIFI